MFPMLLVVVAVGLRFMVLERLFPEQKHPRVPGWWPRPLVVNLMQAAVVILAGYTWDRWFDAGLLALHSWPAPLGAALRTFFLTFVYYGWHRWCHDWNFLWLACRPLHHSPSRIEAITSFHQHPLELVANGIFISAVNYALFGLDPEGGAWVTLYTATAEFFYHRNVRTPRWVGYVVQRPEMHRIHHERGRHYSNFADLPMWDMFFGTYRNPETFSGPCGFLTEREAAFGRMLLFQKVNGPFRRQRREAAR